MGAATAYVLELLELGAAAGREAWVGLLQQTCLDEDRSPNQTPQVGGNNPGSGN